MISIRSFQPSINITSEIGATQGKRGMRRQGDPTLRGRNGESSEPPGSIPARGSAAGGESSSPAPAGKGRGHPGLLGVPTVSPRAPNEGPLSLAVEPYEAVPALRGAAVQAQPPHSVASGGTPKRGTPKRSTTKRSALSRRPLSAPPRWLVPTVAGPRTIPRSTNHWPWPLLGAAPCLACPGVKMLMSLNVPGLRVLRAVVSLMPGAWASQHSSPIGDVNQAEEGFQISQPTCGVSVLLRGVVPHFCRHRDTQRAHP